MTKSCEDMEDIIRILIDMFDNMNVDFNTVMLKVRDKHYCLFCMQHYRHCKCDFANVAISSDSESEHSSANSSTDEDYTSSESEQSSSSGSKSEQSNDKSHSDKSHSEFSESCSENESEEQSESESEDDKIINKIISNLTLKKVILDDSASSSASEDEL